LGLQ
jgi:hypothetical protein